MTTTYHKSLFLIQTMWKVTDTSYTSDGFGQSVSREPSSGAVADSDLSPQVSESTNDVDGGVNGGPHIRSQPICMLGARGKNGGFLGCQLPS